MFNRLLMAVHWVLLIFFLTGFPLGAIAYYIFDEKLPWKGPYFVIGLVLFVVYIIALWIIKHRWIWFPWQHDKD